MRMISLPFADNNTEYLSDQLSRQTGYEFLLLGCYGDLIMIDSDTQNVINGINLE
ncbi:hypothetical protein SAMN05216334_102218 [Nitrosomonas ureae]|uniref:Uncharacterized protein n=1 Tax=Nitrosomonas ureae TaxID=44577 RepID=A0A1H5SKS4_9PROT|nr:hypothetical protein SAMN05216334_102218 [Nitrosomonas ureae]